MGMDKNFYNFLYSFVRKNILQDFTILFSFLLFGAMCLICPWQKPVVYIWEI